MMDRWEIAVEFPEQSGLVDFKFRQSKRKEYKYPHED